MISLWCVPLITTSLVVKNPGGRKNVRGNYRDEFYSVCSYIVAVGIHGPGYVLCTVTLSLPSESVGKDSDLECSGSSSCFG